jgi:hypothetical protein
MPYFEWSVTACMSPGQFHQKKRENTYCAPRGGVGYERNKCMAIYHESQCKDITHINWKVNGESPLYTVRVRKNNWSY